MSSEELMNNIQDLQKTEQNLFQSLETNHLLTSEQQQKLIDQINQISKIRMNLYQNLGERYQFYKTAASLTDGTLKEQAYAINIIENELNHSKQRLSAIEADKNNKIRLIEINNYYSDKYVEHTKLIKILIFTFIPVILLTFLKKKAFLPERIYYILLIIVVFIGALFFWYTYVSIIMRDNMNYQEYDWYFNPGTAPAPTTSSASASSDPWSSGFPSTCIGSACCSVGQTYDTTQNKCIAPEGFTRGDFYNTII